MTTFVVEIIPDSPDSVAMVLAMANCTIEVSAFISRLDYCQQFFKVVLIPYTVYFLLPLRMGLGNP